MELRENHPTLYCLIFEQALVVNISIPNRQNYAFESDSEHSIALRIEVFFFKNLILFFLRLLLSHFSLKGVREEHAESQLQPVRLQTSEAQNTLKLFIAETLSPMKKPLQNSSYGSMERKRGRTYLTT